ncbi:uncharacterized protein DUF2635 [Paucimonas lemoignei]|uniref:Uncharacterized protein DUF2635 n=1 Tax=Paucimonas lemoignei TaxID=29443 RepID=A0A4R3HUU1_PAULE|nr:DUF2635 domain-containing protein [Paucimonas lemoignei]TCS35795.1 uncharacterized protein DUF2635 [Paucimonas lemoignei]
MDKKLVKPREGLQIPRHDGNGNLPAEGMVVGMNSYYWGLKHDGDVTVENVPVEPEQPEAAAPGEPSQPAATASAEPKKSKK